MSNLLQRFFFFAQYLGKPRWDTGITPPELQRLMDALKPGRALDIGCGTGINVCFLAQAGWQVTGVDFVPLAIRRARQRLRAAGLKARFVVGDAARLEGLPLGEPFDLAVDIGCLHSLTQEGIRGYCQGLRRWLLPGGAYLLYAHQPGSIRAGHGISRDDIETSLGADFVLVEYTPGFEGDWKSAWYYFIYR